VGDALGPGWAIKLVAIPLASARWRTDAILVRGDTAGVEWTIRAAGTWRSRSACPGFNALPLDTFERRRAQHPPTIFVAFVTGYTVDLVAHTRRDISKHVGGGGVQVAVGIGQQPTIGTVFVSSTGDGGTVGIGKSIRVVVDTVAGFRCGFTGQQHRFIRRVPNMIHRTAVGGEWWNVGLGGPVGGGEVRWRLDVGSWRIGFVRDE